MEINRLTLPPIPRPGEVTTFYSFENGAARSIALAHAAVQLAAGQNATVPVLMIDWDTEAPGLHHYFPTRDERFEDPRPDFRPDARAAARAAAVRPGLLEYFEACREQLQQLQSLGRAGADLDHEERARLVLEAIDWEAYVERVDQSRSLYLMRAGRFDDSYGERADRMDWDGLFSACPALYRAFAAHLARHFRHVLVDARAGRSAAVSVCTTLLPDRLVGLFTPGGRSLDGLGGVVARAVEYRCSHEDEQRPLLVYPLPCGLEGADPERRALWRRGDPQRGIPGYQPALEQLLRNCYGLSQLSLDSYLDEVPLLASMAVGAPGDLLGASALRDADCHAPARSMAALLGWLGQGRFPWQSRAELDLLDAIAASRAALAAGGQGAVLRRAGTPDPNAAPLARDLLRLGELQRVQGRSAQAQECFEESTALRQRLFGDSHPDTRASRSALAALLRDTGRLHDARVQYELLLEHCLQGAGEGHAETLAARSGLAATLAQVEEFPRALALHEAVVEACERLYGPGHIATLDALAGQARTLARQGEYSRARMVYERVLEGRQRILGTEHEDTLRCTQLLATLLRDMGDLGNARKLQEGVLKVRERQSGPDAAATLQAREALAEIFAAQGDLCAVREMQQSLATARERRLGSEHPDHPAAPGHHALGAGRTRGSAAPAAARRQPARAPARHGRPRDPAQQADAGADPVEPGPQPGRAPPRSERGGGQQPPAEHPRHVRRAARCARPGGGADRGRLRRHAGRARRGWRGGRGRTRGCDGACRRSARERHRRRYCAAGGAGPRRRARRLWQCRQPRRRGRHARRTA